MLVDKSIKALYAVDRKNQLKFKKNTKMVDKSTDINLLQSGALAFAETQCEILKPKNAVSHRQVQCQLPETRSVGTSPSPLHFCSAKNDDPIRPHEFAKEQVDMIFDDEKENQPRYTPKKIVQSAPFNSKPENHATRRRFIP